MRIQRGGQKLPSKELPALLSGRAAAIFSNVCNQYSNQGHKGKTEYSPKNGLEKSLCLNKVKNGFLFFSSTIPFIFIRCLE